jgi:hypothetical protein
MPNAQHQTFHGFMTGAPYELAIVEFDDQGRAMIAGRWMVSPSVSKRWRRSKGRARGRHSHHLRARMEARCALRRR